MLYRKQMSRCFFHPFSFRILQPWIMLTVDIQPTKHSCPCKNRPLAGKKIIINLLIRAKGTCCTNRLHAFNGQIYIHKLKLKASDVNR